ncbi:GspJ family type II secretion system protein [Sandaracinobacter neustonicus]|nr:GspJ family type II secretion system protein [Sandaracinobacter neustonicus]
MRRSARPNGFTLVEMLVSLLIFSIIASIATAMTVGATRSFAASSTALAALSDLDRTRSVLAADLGQAAERPSLAADGSPMPAFTLTPDGFVLVRYRAGDVLPGIEKVAWGVVDGQLLRQPFPAIDGAPPGEPLAMLEGISAVRIRVADRNGWRDDWAPRQPEELPRAVEMTLIRAGGVPVTLKFLVAA